jgi:hypothetical protein
MFTKLSKFLSGLLVAALLVTAGASAAFAQELNAGPGSGPGNAARPTAGAVEIAPGSWQWYAFRSQVPVQGDEDEAVVIANRLNEAVINATLRTQSGNVDFEVWSADNVNEWIAANDFDPVGAGTENESITGDPLYWEGAFTTNNTYYLIVMNRGSQAATYSLDVTGNVSFPTQLALNGAAQEAVMSTGEMALTVAAPAAAAGAAPMTTAIATGPEMAGMPAAGNVEIAPQSWQWYAFSSQVPLSVDAEGNDVTNVVNQAKVNAILRNVSGNVDFEVWSADNLRDWVNGTDFDATGAGTTNESISGDPLFWEGSFTTNNLYYLVVKNRSNQPATYNLSVVGDVSFPAANSLAVK